MKRHAGPLDPKKKVLLLVRPVKHPPMWWPPDRPVVYYCNKCLWGGTDPDRGAKKLTCPGCWFRKNKRVQVSPDPGSSGAAWVTVTPNGGWTIGEDWDKQNLLPASFVTDLQSAWEDDYAHPDDKTVRTWEWKTIAA